MGHLALAALVAAAAAAAYGATLAYGLVWDDPQLIAYVRGRLAEVGLPGLLATKLPAPGGIDFYRPLVLLAFWADGRLGGGAAWVYHLTNVALHTGAALLVYLVLARLGARAGALVGGLLFAVHPVHVESVAFVSGRSDLLAGIFVLASVLAWLRVREGAARNPRRELSIGACCFALGCLSKEAAFALPAVLLAWEALLPSRGTPWWERNRSWLAAWGKAAAVVAVLRWVIASAGPVWGSSGPGAGLPADRGLLAAGMVVAYLRLLVLPWPLNAYYTPSGVRLTAAGVAGAVLFLALCAATAPARYRRSGLLALAWAVGFLVPVAGLAFGASAMVAERYLYLPSVGVCLAVAAVVGAARRPWLGAAAAAPLVALALAGTLARAPVWRDELVLFGDMARRSPDSPLAHYNLGIAYGAADRGGEALEALAAAVRLAPSSADALFALGEEFWRQGRVEEAADALARGLAQRPESPRALAELGLAYGALGLHAAAVESLRGALRCAPGNAFVLNDLGTELASLGELDEAVGAFREALELSPEYAAARYNLCAVLVTGGDVASALREARELRRTAPELADEIEALASGAPPEGQRGR